MKISYNVLKKYLPYLESPEKTAEDLIMHTAEVEDIYSKLDTLKRVLTWKLLNYEKVNGSDKLNVWQFDFWNEGKKQIIFGSVFWLKIWEVYPVALAPTILPTWIEIKKTKMLGVSSEGMVCADEELGTSYTTEWLIRFSGNTPLGVPAIEIMSGWNIDTILEIDNKAINHRPDMFSHIGVMRELATIYEKDFSLLYEEIDFSGEKKYMLENQIPELVKRYIALCVNNVENSESPKEIKEFIEAIWNNSKWILVDITNYSLSFYWQPTHCFDKDKVKGAIVIRFAKSWEKFLALDNKEYELDEKDIVIADNEKILALGWIIGGKESSVSETTKSIIIEGANFPWDILRHTGRKLGIRTDALNLFEKNIPASFALHWVSLIYKTLKDIFPKASIESYGESYPKRQEQIKVDYDIKFINKLIWASYKEERVVAILKRLGIEKQDSKLFVPFWRSDIKFKADIAEEIARIDGYDKIISTITDINLWAIKQENIYKLKEDTRKFFTDKGFFDMYSYSFVNEDLMKKTWWEITHCIEMKNYLSEELTHLKNSLIPHLLQSLEENRRDFEKLKLFEIEKIFHKTNSSVNENYSLWGVMVSKKEKVYYDIQNILTLFFKKIGVDKYEYKKSENYPSFAHAGRTAQIIVRGQSLWIIWEIHPLIGENFDIQERIWFFEINADKLASLAYNTKKATDLSSFQENNFDLSFLIDKEKSGKEIEKAIIKTNPKLIKKVSLFDIYENEEKLPWKRSLSFTIYIQSDEETLGDTVKNELIEKIIKNVEKAGGKLRS